jgi:hypothetical protein
MLSQRSGPDPEGRPGLSILALGGWVVGAAALAALAWTQLRPKPPAPPVVAQEAAPAPAAAPEPPPRPPAPPPAAGARPASLEEVVGRGIAAVVTVETDKGKGSAFFVAPDRLLTNVHVVSGNSYVTIRRSNGETATAFVEATSPDYDIAVLKLASPAATQVTIPLGSAGDLRPGQEVIAIGSPLGLQNSVTRGIVSSLRQMGPVTVVQTDAAINPGNSGGPLLDRNGSAIGINTFILTTGRPSGVQGGSQGLNFAIAIDHAKALLEGRSPAEGALAQDNGNGLNRQPPASETEQQQTQGSRLYEARLAQLAQAADTLDRAWERLLAKGYQGKVEGSFERGWYALWADGALRGTFVPGFEASLDQVRSNADTIKRLSITADEDARTAGVLPGTRRELRQKYRLDYPGWGL